MHIIKEERQQASVTIEPWVVTAETTQALLGLIMETWGGNYADPISVACESHYMAHCLRRTTTGFVAREDGRIVGVCLVGGMTNGRRSDNVAWAERESHLMRILESIPWEGNRIHQSLACVREEDSIANSASIASLRPDAEVVLLVVEANRRRRGIGRRLVGEVRRVAKRRRWNTLFLVTDTDCDWKAYEGWGFARVASMPSPSDLGCLRMAYAFTPDMMPITT